MARLAEDEGLRARLGAAGRERIVSGYTLELMIDRTLAVYDIARARFTAGRNGSNQHSPSGQFKNP
jgi:glycosyltransferase involved in cell wall biosynthesis